MTSETVVGVLTALRHGFSAACHAIQKEPFQKAKIKWEKDDIDQAPNYGGNLTSQCPSLVQEVGNCSPEKLSFRQDVKPNNMKYVACPI